MPNQVVENFDSVAGAKEAKEELGQIADYLKNSKKYRSIGAKIRKGVLLTGTPGNGKTLLARALAGEVKCPFLVITGSDFISKFIGDSAKNVQNLFAIARKLAKKHGACIIFIDEIDSIGFKRGIGFNTEREAALNKLLAEIDGFSKEDNPIVLIGATNRQDMLDDALLRPGRFDRIISVKNPNMQAREEILKIHSKYVKIDNLVNFKTIAKATIGFSGAELANLINEAALTAYRSGNEYVTMNDLEESIDTLLLGKESNIVLSEKEKKITAFHEAGHALVTLLNQEYSIPLHKVTIVPRADAMGVTFHRYIDDKYSINKEEMLAKIMTLLGGRVAEEIIFDNVTTGAYSDFAKATDIVRDMVCCYGMSDTLGPIVYSQQQGDFVYSQETAKRIDDQVLKIIKKCYEDVKILLMQNKDKLTILANALLEKKTMTASEIYNLLNITQPQDQDIA